MLISLSGSAQVAPTQWLDWNTGVSYFVAVQTPQYRMNSIDRLMSTPVARRARYFQFVHAHFGCRRIERRRCRHRWRPQPGIPGVRQSRSRQWRAATAVQYGRPLARHRPRNHQPLQCAAGIRCVRQRRRPRPGSRRLRRRKTRGQSRRKAAPRDHHRHARTGQHHGKLLLPSGTGNDSRHRPGVPAHGRQLSVLAGPVYHPDGAARERWPASSGFCSSPRPRSACRP